MMKWKLNPTRSDQRRCLPYGWEITDWFHTYILPLPERPYAMTSEEWEAWRIRMRKSNPFRYWLHNTMRTRLSVWTRRYLKDPYWWVRHRIDPRHRYHIVRTGLPPGYWDSDSRILYAVMEEVQNFVTGTKSHVDWHSDLGHRRAWKILTEAVSFWAEYKAFWNDDDHNISRWNGNDTEGYYLPSNAWEDENKMERRADVCLAKIMTIRQYLWWP